ncbi:phosphatases II [Exidia glandulosa HHB12029]|uniref:Phosphatases II n=1 Tax=Exidia glandulosa HHB12029 TaxID=1314781 RepID=A0A165JPI3_EXIGL|nr:phosphatases II [Exidia glandulosa HHB12029]
MSVTQLSPVVHQQQHVAYTPQQMLQREAMQAAPWQTGYVSQDDREKAAALAHLASQHHTSDYNRLKFGPKGAPFAYVPISIQFPAHVHELRVRQAQSALRTAWWPSQRMRIEQMTSVQLAAGVAPEEATGYVDARQRAPPCLHPPTSPTLQHELSLAMTSQLSIGVPQLSPQAQALLPKTSETHPINISTLVPFELLPLISTWLISTNSTHPTIFRIPPTLQLDRLTRGAPLPAKTPNHDLPPPPPPPFSTTGMQIVQQASVTVSTTVTIKPDASNYPPEPYPAARESSSVSAPLPSVTETATTTTHVTTVSQHQPTVLKFDAAELASTLNEGGDPEVAAPASSRTLEPRGSATPAPVAAPPPSAPSTATNPSTCPPPFILGNLLLSSCPGKKGACMSETRIRLTGPVKGRGAICRDLRSDLSRVKDLGVGCIVCCLDDDELDFLGASWSEYSTLANSIGLDVLRLPTPEGLAPLTPRVIDEHLGRVISQYTLRGIPILVHCRGGVGRAGLIACCWMLKLGLCGWEGESVTVVERAIAVVRRRRSVKAIETFEQVRFLVDFVEYLREQGAQ